jgi:hypothetical protein
MATAFAAADTLQLGSYATNSSIAGDANTAVNYAGFSLTNTISSGTGASFTLDPAGVWAAALSNSTWVGAAADAGPGGTNPLSGYYTFTTTFDATGTYSGTLSVLADDTTEVFLNGVLLIGDGGLGADTHCADGVPNCSTVDTITLSGISLSGTNTLTFVVQQAGDQAPGKDPSGFDFNASLTQVPEPGSLMLLGTGLVSSAGVLFRRRRA